MASPSGGNSEYLIGRNSGVAELASAAFLGLEVLTQNGREIDIDAIASHVSMALTAISALTPRC